MSDIKLFRYANERATELTGKSVATEKTLQKLSGPMSACRWLATYNRIQMSGHRNVEVFVNGS